MASSLFQSLAAVILGKHQPKTSTDCTENPCRTSNLAVLHYFCWQHQCQYANIHCTAYSTFQLNPSAVNSSQLDYCQKKIKNVLNSSPPLTLPVMFQLSLASYKAVTQQTVTENINKPKGYSPLSAFFCLFPCSVRGAVRLNKKSVSKEVLRVWLYLSLRLPEKRERGETSFSHFGVT